MKFDTSPAGVSPTFNRLTAIRQSPAVDPRDKLYCRICLAPSGKATCTDMYCPGRKFGNSPDTPRNSNPATSADSN
ncbi:Uncharacterised protein [Mycobacteroides abscessus subsp. abscessus]|nr:Uncharacterised protein [Mycobacteroides abscessus subsp. abscessus]